MHPEAIPRSKPQRGVQSLETGGAILRALARAAGPVKLRDLAEAVGMVPSQLHPYLVSLRAIRLVEQTDTGLYALGPFALDLGLARLRGQDAYHETMQRVAPLAEQLQLMVAISVWGLHGPTIVYVKESSSRIHANVRAGGMFALTTTATGRLFAAFLPRMMTEGMVAQELPDPARAAAYWAEAAQIRAAGYATTLDLPIPGVSAVAAPVLDHSGEMQLAVTVIGPTALIDLSAGGPAVRGLLAFTRQLSADLGHVGADRAAG